MDLLGELLSSLGESDVPSARDRSAKLADENDHADLRELTAAPKSHTPTLLRWAPTRG